MENQFSRTELLIGKENVQKLNKAKVAIFGLGGVGSFVAEGLVRAGVQNFLLVDNDKISISNLNRQIIATTNTIGKYKVDIMKQRMLDINPDANVITSKEFFMPNSSHDMIDSSLDYIVDAVDTVAAKIELIMTAKKIGIPIICAMGTGNKLDPTKFEVCDIYETEICPLAKVMRKELKKRGIEKLKVLYSKEEPTVNKNNIKNNIGSISFVPSVAGLIIAGEIIKDLTDKC